MPNTTYGTPFVASSDLVAAYPGVSSNLATRLDQVSYAGNGLNDQTGTAYTLVFTDAGKTITLSNASAVTVTIPANASVAMPTGTMVRFVNRGAGAVTVQPAGGVTLNGGNISLAQFAAVQVVKLASDTWGVIESTGSTPGLSIVAPSSIANTGGTASVSGAVVTFTGATSISLNGVFTSTFPTYVVHVVSTGATAQDYSVRLRASGADNTASAYNATILDWFGSTGNPFAVNGFTSFTNIGRASATPGSAMEMTFYNPATAVPTFVKGHDAESLNTSRIQVSAGYHNVASAFDGLTIFVGASSFTGSIRVYGYRNS